MTAIFLADDVAAAISRSHLDELKKLATAAPKRRARYCLHADHDDPIQEMIIAFHRSSTVPAHRHPGKAESFHLVEGCVCVTCYDDAGDITLRVEMDSTDADSAQILKIPVATWHEVEVRTEFAVVHEVSAGPFREEDTEWR
jgi:cupin fold WbuC family metalloprotein